MTLRAEAVSFAYPKGPPVLRGVTLDLLAGSLTAVVGPNGAGKSTLLRLLLGTLRPGAGRITLDGRPLTTRTARARARRISYIAQRSTVTFPFTVRQVVGMGRFATPDDDPAAARALASVGLADRARETFGVLSAGQQQRASLARALAQIDGSPSPVLLADEPVAAMDPRHALETMAALRALAGSGAAVVVVLHDLNLAARYATHAALLAAGGTIVRAGPAAEVLDPGVLAPVYGVPFVRGVVGGQTTLLPVDAGHP